MTPVEQRKIQFFRGPITSHVQLAESTWEIGFESVDLATQFAPGQFAMLRLADRQDAILGRAFAVWDRACKENGQPNGVKFVYLVKGRMTRPLSAMPPGTLIEAWGPLGNAFPDHPVAHLILVAGGVGQTPMLTVAQEALGLEKFADEGRARGYANRVTLIYGARSARYLAGLEKFAEVEGLELLVTTEDGSMGRQGRVTDELNDLLDKKTTDSIRIQCCGPEPMMEAVSKMASDHQVECHVSLETPMACGIGICFTCVAKIIQEAGSWDYRRTCMEGPIFDSRKICWH